MSEMDTMPIIRLEVDRLRHSMIVALTDYHVQMDAMVQEAVNQFCTEDNLRRIINDESKRTLDSVVREAVKNWWMYSEDGQAIIKKEVAKKLKEEAKYYE